ncbi:hypothetical protein SeMB42_g05081 [Synchytrium endobioticum]|uniref:Integrator complex subunit 7 N-terminal domain-containing protein n=1 Tax=Synchytrium endobioticum TaxID=286115 RepID=A0A507CTY3_9FUNG|nr:hypothetical protein SeMB42_g05081 [Synchytrium endobioticum]
MCISPRPGHLPTVKITALAPIWHSCGRCTPEYRTRGHPSGLLQEASARIGLLASNSLDLLASTTTTTALAKADLLADLCSKWNDPNDRISILDALSTINWCQADAPSQLLLSRILKPIVNVLHSNDHIARAQSFKLLACISPLLKDRLEIHHLIRQGLDSANDLELDASISATIAVASESPLFALHLCDKVYSIVTASPGSSKCAQLLQFFAHIQLDYETEQKAQALCRDLLQRNLVIADSIIVTRTLSAMAMRYPIRAATQIDFLLSRISTATIPSIKLSSLYDLHSISREALSFKPQHLTAILQLSKLETDDRHLFALLTIAHRLMLKSTSLLSFFLKQDLHLLIDIDENIRKRCHKSCISAARIIGLAIKWADVERLNNYNEYYGQTINTVLVALKQTQTPSLFWVYSRTLKMLLSDTPPCYTAPLCQNLLETALLMDETLDSKSQRLLHSTVLPTLVTTASSQPNTPYDLLISTVASKSPLLLYTICIACAQFGWFEPACSLSCRINTSSLSMGVNLWIELLQKVYQHQARYTLCSGSTADLHRSLSAGLDELCEALMLLNAHPSPETGFQHTYLKLFWTLDQDIIMPILSYQSVSPQTGKDDRAVVLLFEQSYWSEVSDSCSHVGRTLLSMLGSGDRDDKSQKRIEEQVRLLYLLSAVFGKMGSQPISESIQTVIYTNPIPDAPLSLAYIEHHPRYPNQPPPTDHQQLFAEIITVLFKTFKSLPLRFFKLA